MRIGFVGLGRMGSGMAGNLLRNGADLTVFDMSEDACASFLARGAKAAPDLGALAGGADVLFMSLPGPNEVRDAVYGPGGILANLTRDSVLVDLSTGSRALAVQIDGDCRDIGAHMLDAPVSGGPAGAASGDLAFWVGGDEDIYERCLPIFQMMGDKPRLCGPIGSGTVVKLVNNMTGYSILMTLAETFSMGVKAGVDPLELWEALRLGVVGKASPLDMLRAQFLPGKYEEPAFALRLAYKDVKLATDLGRELDVPLRNCNLVAAEMLEAVGKGFGDQDSRAYLKLQLERAGVEIAVDEDRLRAAFEGVARSA